MQIDLCFKPNNQKPNRQKVFKAALSAVMVLLTVSRQLWPIVTLLKLHI